MKDQPLVSVLLSVYNAAPFLRAAIESILQQSYPHFELLLINDGSTDESLDIIRSFQDERIRLLDDCENKGLTARLNEGIELAQGQYIARMDADDISLPQRLKKQVAFLETHPEIVIVGTQIELLIEAQQRRMKPKPLPCQHRDILAYMLFYCPFSHPSVMIRTAVAKENKYNADFRLTQDFNLWTHLLRTHKGANLEEVLLHYRIHDNNIAIKNRATTLANLRKIFRIQFERWQIPFTKEELETHLLLSDSNAELLTATQLTSIRQWFDKLQRHNEKHQHFNTKYFQELLTLVKVESWRWKVKSAAHYFTLVESPFYSSSVSWRQKWQVLRSFLHHLRKS